MGKRTFFEKSAYPNSTCRFVGINLKNIAILRKKISSIGHQIQMLWAFEISQIYKYFFRVSIFDLVKLQMIETLGSNILLTRFFNYSYFLEIYVVISLIWYSFFLYKYYFILFLLKNINLILER